MINEENRADPLAATNDGDDHGWVAHQPLGFNSRGGRPHFQQRAIHLLRNPLVVYPVGLEGKTVLIRVSGVPQDLTPLRYHIDAGLLRTIHESCAEVVEVHSHPLTLQQLDKARAPLVKHRFIHPDYKPPLPYRV